MNLSCNYLRAFLIPFVFLGPTNVAASQPAILSGRRLEPLPNPPQLPLPLEFSQTEFPDYLPDDIILALTRADRIRTGRSARRSSSVILFLPVWYMKLVWIFLFQYNNLACLYINAHVFFSFKGTFKKTSGTGMDEFCSVPTMGSFNSKSTLFVWCRKVSFSFTCIRK